MKRLLKHIQGQWAGLLALFLVLAGGTAYAANTISSTDIVDGQVKTADLGNAAVTNAKLGGNSVISGTVANGSIMAQDLAPGVGGGSGAAGPRAYGYIAGTFHTRDKNVVSVTNPSPGRVCIKFAAGINPSALSAVASPDYATDDTHTGVNTDQVFVEVQSSSPCGVGYLGVVTLRRYQTTGTVAGVGVVTSNVLEEVNEPFFFVLG